METGTALLIILAVLIIFVIAILLFVFSNYNALVQIKHNVDQAWSNIDVLLKQRHDELPKLVEVCRQYQKFEQETLERIMRARHSVQEARERQDLGALGAAEGQLRAGLGSLFAVVENYPELRTNERYRQLEARISSLEEAIADRREFYNAAVNINNVRMEQFPTSLLAGMAKMRARRLLQFSEAETRDVNLRELFS